MQDVFESKYWLRVLQSYQLMLFLKTNITYSTTTTTTTTTTKKKLSCTYKQHGIIYMYLTQSSAKPSGIKGSLICSWCEIDPFY